MLRVSHLPADLSAFLRHAQRQPFVFGHFDCTLMLADWWLANHGVDPAADWRGTFATQADCNALLRRHGGLPRLLARMALQVGAVRTTDPQPGDFAVIRAPTLWAAAIRTPTGRWAVKEGEGLTAIREARIVAAWKI
ncbi:hypothetical protein KHC28_01105 [Ancylobacter sonchi]|nr:hypothetical protein [Ancylobacter sonchi]